MVCKEHASSCLNLNIRLNKVAVWFIFRSTTQHERMENREKEKDFDFHWSWRSESIALGWKWSCHIEWKDTKQLVPTLCSSCVPWGVKDENEEHIIHCIIKDVHRFKHVTSVRSKTLWKLWQVNRDLHTAAAINVFFRLDEEGLDEVLPLNADKIIESDLIHTPQLSMQIYSQTRNFVRPSKFQSFKKSHDWHKTTLAFVAFDSWFVCLSDCFPFYSLWTKKAVNTWI